jgi:retron-type reverse transcriptase
LVHIFNLSLVQGTFPDIWKTAKTVPIHKGGNLAQIENYRPVALLSSFSKVFEIAIFNSLSSVWRSFLTPSQHGFSRGRSTVTNLVCVTQFISKWLDRRGQGDMIYTDVAKAFDRVDHNILLQKLSEFGVHGLLLKWFSSYLTGRRQLAPYNGFSSGEYSQGSGVPQGSVLGPLLFNVYINDIVTDLESHALLFADNLKIYRQVSSSEHCVMLQNDLETIDKWCRQNNFGLNIGKCSLVSFSRKIESLLTTLAKI